MAWSHLVFREDFELNIIVALNWILEIEVYSSLMKLPFCKAFSLCFF
jgi:hypothetical protein